jgi:hypothetical protein
LVCGSDVVFRSTASALGAVAAGNGGTTVNELIEEWLAQHGPAWRKKLEARTGLLPAKAQEVLPPAVECLVTVLRRGRLDLAAFVRGADPVGITAMADARGFALHQRLDAAIAHDALAAVAPGVLDAARRAVKTEEGVQRLLGTSAVATEVGAIGSFASRLFRARGS